MCVMDETKIGLEHTVVEHKMEWIITVNFILFLFYEAGETLFQGYVSQSIVS